MSHNLSEEKEGGRRPEGRGYIIVVLLVIGGLLGSAIFAVIWFISLAALDSTPASIAPTALPTEEYGRESLAATDTASELPSQLEPSEIKPIAAPINRIVYIRPDGQVATIAGEGSDEHLLTDTSQAYQFPAWSPDGQFLAVIGSDLSGSGVYLLTDAVEPSATPRTLYASRDETPFYLYWSPDSRQVSFLANYPGNTLGLYVASVSPENSVRLLATGNPFYWDWTAEGDQILIHTGFAGETSKLAMLDITDAGGEKEIAQPGFFQAPGISANGRYLAYAEEVSPGLSELVIADTVTGETHRERHAGLVAMGWNPVGDQLAVISSADQEDQFHGPLRLIDAQSGEMTLLSRDVVLAFFWSRDGRHLAVISIPTANNDLNARRNDPVPDKTPAQQARLNAFGRPTAIGPGLQRPEPLLLDLSIIEVTSGENRYFYSFEPTRAFVTQFLPFFDQYALSHQLWSPDNDALVLPMHFDGQDGVYLIRTRGGHPMWLAEGDMAFWSHQ
jgi:TolB protein